MANYDMTYCSRDCKNMKCIRNYKYAPHDRPISIAEFLECKKYVEKEPVYVSLGARKTNKRPTEG